MTLALLPRQERDPEAAVREAVDPVEVDPVNPERRAGAGPRARRRDEPVNHRLRDGVAAQPAAPREPDPVPAPADPGKPAGDRRRRVGVVPVADRPDSYTHLTLT